MLFFVLLVDVLFYFYISEATILMSVATETQDQVQRRGRGRGVRGRRGRPAGGILTNPRLETIPGSTLVSPDGTAWTIIEPGRAPGRYGCQNVFRDRVGPTPHAKRNVDETCKSAWQLMVTKKNMQHILECTMEEARRELQDKDWYMTIEELEAFIGILYIRGAIGAHNLDLDSLWSIKWGNPIIKATMSRNRFREIMKYLRFDHKSSRRQRLNEDKFAMISEIWYEFITNVQACYIPGPYITIDEQLFPSKCRCRFTQFMSSKPDKYGQKFWMAVDKDANYIINAFPYLGKDDHRPNDERLGDWVVKKLIEPYINKGRNVTCDNFFTSLLLAGYLNSKNTSIVGTVNRVRREIPASVKTAKEELYKTSLLKTGDTTLTVYQTKPNKNVLILSTMHQDITISPSSKRKPETVLFYNSTKYGVDVVDSMSRKYTVKAASRRWPVHTFYNLLDLAAINAWVLYKIINNSKIKRRDFLLQLGEELGSQYMTNRKTAIPVEIPENIPGKQEKRTRCQVKSNCTSNKSSVKCHRCTKTACKKCIGEKYYLCNICHSDNK